MDDVWHLFLVFKAFQSPSKSFQTQRYFPFFHLQAQWARKHSFSFTLPSLSHPTGLTMKKVSVKECKRLWIIWLLRLACYFHRGRNSFFSAKNHIYSPVKVAAVKVSSNSPGPVGRDCKRFYWKRVQSNRISIVWLLYLKETPCSIKHQREITF